MSDFGDTTFPTARKEHRCNYCFGPIPAGETYSRWTGVFDGEFQSNAMHLECDKQYNIDDTYSDGYTPGEAEMPDRVKAIVEKKVRQ